MNAAQKKVSDAVQKLVEDLDKDCMRKMQAEMHRCSATCCDSTSASLEDTHSCIAKCTEPMSRAQNYVQSELQRYQSRIERCIMQCQDNVKDKITADSSKEQMDSLKNQFEKCAVECIDTNINVIPTLFKKMREAVKKGKYDNLV